jgi:hypothetical protein
MILLVPPPQSFKDTNYFTFNLKLPRPGGLRAAHDIKHPGSSSSTVTFLREACPFAPWLGSWPELGSSFVGQQFVPKVAKHNISTDGPLVVQPGVNVVQLLFGRGVNLL